MTGKLVELISELEEQEALERVEPSAAAAYTLAEILIEAGRHEEAKAPLRRYLTRAGVTEKTVDGVYRAYAAGKSLGPARVFFEWLVEKGPGRRVAHAHYRRACVLDELGERSKALDSIREAIHLNGKDPRYQKKRREILSLE